MSRAGYWVTHVIAFEHRSAAAIADDGIVSVARTWYKNLPQPLLDLYRSGDKSAFDQQMRQAMSAAADAATDKPR